MSNYLNTKKVVLIQSKYFNFWESLGCGYIGAVAKERHKNLELSFFQGYFDSDKEIIESSKDADIIAFSCTSPAYSHALFLAKSIKKLNPNCYTVFGGWHASAVPDIVKEDVIDSVVVGEGDLVFSEIIEGRREPVIKASPVKDLDSLPFPDRGLIKNHREIDLAQKMTGLRMTSFQSMRGCPRSCAFCSEHVVSGKLAKDNHLRIRSPGNIINEINKVAKDYGLEYFKFVDPTWNISEDKVISFCEEKIRTGNTLPWECNSHASLVTENMLKAMKEAGCCQINIGCESGSIKILRDMHKGLTIEHIKKAFALGRKVGLKRRSFFLLGMPNETEADIRMTEQLVEEIDPDVFGITILCPYPGSELFSENLSGVDWSATDEYKNDFWRSKALSNEQLKYWQNYLVNKFKDRACWHNNKIKEEA